MESSLPPPPPENAYISLFRLSLFDFATHACIATPGSRLSIFRKFNILDFRVAEKRGLIKSIGLPHFRQSTTETSFLESLTGHNIAYAVCRRLTRQLTMWWNSWDVHLLYLWNDWIFSISLRPPVQAKIPKPQFSIEKCACAGRRRVQFNSMQYYAYLRVKSVPRVYDCIHSSCR